MLWDAGINTMLGDVGIKHNAWGRRDETMLRGWQACVWLCPAGVRGYAPFSTVGDQREHFRSDWHRYNLKRTLAGQQAVTELQFASLLEQDALEVLADTFLRDLCL
jgi:hypothetical protein